jgi:hypothetical protein
MKVVLQLFWQICLLRQGPEHVPTQNWFIATVVSANILCSLALSLVLDDSSSFISVLTRLVVTQATTAALVWLALFLREQGNRFPATVTALFGCDLIITVCFATLVPVVSIIGEGGSTFIFLGFMIWSVAVAGVPLGIGILIAVAMMVLSVATSEVAVNPV